MNTASITQDHTPFASASAARPSDYFNLMKPRVMSLVVFTALTGLVCAPADVNFILGAASILALATGAGAAGALNMWFDADIDAKMSRTRTRPIPAGRVAPNDALAFGLIASVFSVLLMALAANYLAAGLLAFTIAFYAFFYTMILKRNTDQNIVIGGLSGALPPAVAWAAATGDLSLNAWLLVAIIFVWTPAHFWALALYQSSDYERAGVPMLPVTKGAKSARAHIQAYAVVTAVVGVVPFMRWPRAFWGWLSCISRGASSSRGRGMRLGMTAPCMTSKPRRVRRAICLRSRSCISLPCLPFCWPST